MFKGFSVELSMVEGIGQATRKRLEKAGIKSVKDLAMCDTRALVVDGLTRIKLQALKKSAQKALFVAAGGRIVTAAKETTRKVASNLKDWEKQTRAALREALEAAWEAEHRAIEAIRASQSKAVSLANAAARAAMEAQETARRKARFVIDQIATPPKPEPARGFKRWADSAREAEMKAVAAAKRAADAALAAGAAGKARSASVVRTARAKIARDGTP